MTVARREPRFRVPLIATIAVIILVPAFITLGFWQLGRADQKRLLQAEYDWRMNDASVRIGAELQAAEELRFYKVTVQGYYEEGHQFLIDNRIHRGQAGYHVITPLRIGNSSTRILINRGWVPVGEDRQQLPDVSPPPGLQRASGIATVPADDAFMLAKPEPLTEEWQTVWQHLDMKRFAGAVTYPVQPVVILLAPESEAGGYTREWARLDAGIAIHRGYAFQWFILAAALSVIYLYMGWRGTRHETQR